jgi:hypothetical protein
MGRRESGKVCGHRAGPDNALRQPTPTVSEQRAPNLRTSPRGPPRHLERGPRKSRPGSVPLLTGSGQVLQIDRPPAKQETAPAALCSERFADVTAAPLSRVCPRAESDEAAMALVGELDAHRAAIGA